MTTINQDAWDEQDSSSRTQGYGYGESNLNSTRNSAVDPDDDDDDLDDADLDNDDLDDFDDDDLDTEDDLDEDDLDDDDLDEDDDGYDRVGGKTTDDLSSGITSSYDNEPNETPEQEQADTETQGYGSKTEVEQQDRGDEASFSEQNDVTPPAPHEFPDTGSHTETDFTSRPTGRTTGRMVGHEPGTEGI